MLEDVFQTVLDHVEATLKFGVRRHGGLILHIDARHHCVDAAIVKFYETHALGEHEAMACVLHIVQVVGVVYDALYVTFIVPHRHA